MAKMAPAIIKSAAAAAAMSAFLGKCAWALVARAEVLAEVRAFSRAEVCAGEFSRLFTLSLSLSARGLGEIRGCVSCALSRCALFGKAANACVHQVVFIIHVFAIFLVI